ncbi:hypothetical protein F5984_22900 [Rudanella paleaurantiibacter]|uniref:Uncharacterized protein n=1 Tax=Rudanella paleaurantiibacter TaxID=2614655 RepID=A0A7J5TTE9_9BACT|nr:hypothetical protein [Rudanella paleaurantiibacter]KAB7727087.1 hypothetical protein F5984_22900 [Rudanella paleaurantiibacter]
MIHHSNENVLLDDANSPDINKRLMGLISADFVLVADQLKEASYQIRKRGFSDYPIFVASQRPLELGQLLIGAKELANAWDYKATFVDEFVQRQLIGPESVELFKEHYKNPDEYCCLFVVHNEFAGFVYIPFPED